MTLKISFTYEWRCCFIAIIFVLVTAHVLSQLTVSECEPYLSVACSYLTILDMKNCHVKPSYCLLENGFIFSANFIPLPSR